MDSLNEVIDKILGDEWGLFWTAAGVFFALVVKICGQTDDLKRSENARKTLEYIVAMASLLATFAALTVAWFAAVETSGTRQEWWGPWGPFVCIGIALILCAVLLAAAVRDNKSAASSPKSKSPNATESAECKICGHTEALHAAETVVTR